MRVVIIIIDFVAFESVGAGIRSCVDHKLCSNSKQVRCLLPSSLWFCIVYSRLILLILNHLELD